IGWVSTPPLPGPPSLGVQLAPSSSVSAARLVVPESCELNQRPVVWSMKPIGSSEAADDVGKLTSFHAEVGGETESSNVTRSACSPAWNMTLPLLKLAPSDGSPASPPRPFGAGWFAYVIGSVPGGGCVPAVTCCNVALAV